MTVEGKFASIGGLYLSATVRNSCAILSLDPVYRGIISYDILP